MIATLIYKTDNKALLWSSNGTNSKKQKHIRRWNSSCSHSKTEQKITY